MGMVCPDAKEAWCTIEWDRQTKRSLLDDRIAETDAPRKVLFFKPSPSRPLRQTPAHRLKCALRKHLHNIFPDTLFYFCSFCFLLPTHSRSNNSEQGASLMGELAPAFETIRNNPDGPPPPQKKTPNGRKTEEIDDRAQ